MSTLALLSLASLLAAGAPPAASPRPAPVSTDLSTAHRVVSLVDYLASDYPVAVDGGRVISAAEHAEHRSLAAEAIRLVHALGPDAPDASRMAEEILRRIERVAAPDEVAASCRELHDLMVRRFALPTFPRTPPDRAAGRALYLQACAACHGDDGLARTDVAARLDPVPRPFTDPSFDRTLSPYRVYNTMSFGIPGTAMPSYGETVTEKQRWDVAFHVLALVHGGDRAPADARPAATALPLSLADLAVATDADLGERADATGLSPAEVRAAVAGARREAPYDGEGSSLDTAQRLVAASVSAAAHGRWDEASRTALDAYLRGMEPAEGLLRTLDPALTRDLEAAFLDLRVAIGRRAGADELAATQQRISDLLAAARAVVAHADRSPWYALFAAFAIVLREGIEAALVIGAILAVLRRAAPGSAPQPLVARVHAGWITALAAGVLTWLVARTIIGPGQREAAEGVISLLAALLLFTASYWLVRNLETRKWLDLLRRKVTASAAGRHGASLFAVAFFAVYREVFETVLFLEALRLDGRAGRGAVLAGAAAAGVALAGFVWLMFRVGARLPLKPFFAVSSALLAVLSFVLAGEGVHALEEAGLVPLVRVHGPSFPLLGVYPTAFGLGVQGLVVLMFVLAGLHALVHATVRRRRGPLEDAQPQHSRP